VKECLLDDFLERMTGWSSETIRKVVVNDSGQLVLYFTDDARSVYRITDCSAAHIKEILADFQEKGIDVASG
jgi:hypothetical protein